MYYVDTRDKHKPHYGMNNLNSRQEGKKKKKNSTTRKRKQLDDILKIVIMNSINQLNHIFDNEVEHFLVLNVHFQVVVSDFLVQAKPL